MADTAFHERLARINAGQGYVAEGLLANGELDKIRKRQEQGKAPIPVSSTTEKPKKRRLSPAQCLSALILGAACFMAGSLGAFHTFQSAPPAFEPYIPIVEALGPVGISGLLAVFLLCLTGFRSIMRICMMAAGFFALHVAEPQLAQIAPEQWTAMYSAEHTAALQTAAVTQMAEWKAAIPTELALPADIGLSVDLGLPTD